MNDICYFFTPGHDGAGQFTIQWAGGRAILETYGAEAERLNRAVQGKSSSEIRSILIEEATQCKALG